MLVAREQPPKLRAPKKLVEAVEAAGGEVLDYAAPKARELPRWLVGEAAKRGFELEPTPRRLLAERMGEGTARLADELDRLALWAGPGGPRHRGDLEAMVADTSEEVAWALSDAIVDRDPATALAAAERLTDQGEAVTPLIYAVAKRLREASTALELLERGPGTAARSRRRCRCTRTRRRCCSAGCDGRSREQVRASTCAIADLEWWTRGGADYPERVALTLAVRRAAGGRGVEARRSGAGGAGARARAGLLARTGVAVQGALADGGVDPRAERLVLGLGGRVVARGDRRLEALELGLDGAGQAAVLVVLAQRARVALLL